MVRNLAHNAVDYEVLVSVFGPCYQRQRLGHEGSFRFGADCAMLSQYGHRGVTGIAIKDRETKRIGEAAIMLSVFAQLT